MAVARERSRVVPLNAIPTDNPAPLGNAAIEVPQVIAVDVIKPVSTIPVIVLNRFIFLPICSRTSILSRKNEMPQFRAICLIDMIVVLAVL